MLEMELIKLRLLVELLMHTVKSCIARCPLTRNHILRWFRWWLFYRRSLFDLRFWGRRRGRSSLWKAFICICKLFGFWLDLTATRGLDLCRASRRFRRGYRPFGIRSLTRNIICLLLLLFRRFLCCIFLLATGVFSVQTSTSRTITGGG